MSTHPAAQLQSHQQRAHSTVLNLFCGPYVVDQGRRMEIPEGSKRLLAYVALSQGPVERRRAAGALWPSGDDIRAAGNLRSALWRLKGAGIDLLEADKLLLRLRPGTLVDVHVVHAWAARVIAGRPGPDDLSTLRWHPDFLELLPNWYDDWALFERERIRQHLLHGLEALARHLVALGRGAEAVEIAMTVVSIEPLRESAQRVLIEAHLSEGNLIEGRRAFEAFKDLALRELGVPPSAALEALVERPGRQATGSSSSCTSGRTQPGPSLTWVLREA